MSGLFEDLRRAYHARLCGSIVQMRKTKAGLDYHNMADAASRVSIAISRGMIERLGCPIDLNVTQESGAAFTLCTREFLEAAFMQLHHLRPGNWFFPVSETEISRFEQYGHLNELEEILREHTQLRAAFAGDYLVKPDIVVARRPCRDDEINANGALVDDDRKVANLSPMRGRNSDVARPILHASISCKWSIRSDRSQNTRTEALNLLRNRKGPTPHIVAATMEPLPGRLASIAMGTGDIDCTYHAALYELREAVHLYASDDSIDLLETLIVGKRLRDISDLPLDLAS